ncbi:uncharacterized protein si:dkey-93h22.7 isoform X1 [Tachysurus vachellii]|uniref:uncharacterized protein si:dkey-93h22.7 isoform X1 n=1 Tax=Tachysurus vachellii TaxID=175792 RepID=UPI00296B2ABE|nr:uncharacterized protein si:dkey-93h22.7 isoform X1 [Tachysurus vachellii]
MNQRTFFLLVIMGFFAMWQKADTQIILGKPELSGPLISVTEDILEFFCKLDDIQTNETILYQLFHEGNLNKALAEYSSHSQEKAKFVIIAALFHDGRLMCKASMQNNSNITPTYSNWIDFHVLVPVNGTHISSPSSTEDFWEGDSLTLQCNITSGTYVSYKWFLNDRLIHNDSNVLHMSNLSNKHNGKYVCVAKSYLNETFYYHSTSEAWNVYVKEHLTKPEISIEVIKNSDGNISACVKCLVTKGSPPINFTLFNNNHNVDAVTSEHMDALFTLPIALDQDMGTVYCQANNRKHPLKSKELKLKVDSVGGTVTMRLQKSVGKDFEVLGVWLHCLVERGTLIQYNWFINNTRLERKGSFYRTFKSDNSGLTVRLYPNSDTAGFYRCEAFNSFDNTTSVSSTKTLISHEVFNVIPTEEAAIIFTCFSLLICAVLACCIFGVVLRKKRARTYMFKLKDFTDMHSLLVDDHDDDKNMIEENIYKEKNDALDTEAYTDNIFNMLEVLQASMMKDSDESEEEDTNLHYSF